MAKAATELQTSNGLNPILENSIRTLTGNYTTAKIKAVCMTKLADQIEIERTVRVLQVVKGKTYAKALEKENGRDIPELSNLGIARYLLEQRITEGELDAWYRLAVTTKFQYTIYAPLPDMADARQMLDDVRVQLLAIRNASCELLRIEAECKALPEHTCLTLAALRAAISLGMWPLFFVQHKQEAYMLLQWPELPCLARLDYFNSLTPTEKECIWEKATPQAREQACRALYDVQYGNTKG